MHKEEQPLSIMERQEYKVSTQHKYNDRFATGRRKPNRAELKNNIHPEQDMIGFGLTKLLPPLAAHGLIELAECA